MDIPGSNVGKFFRHFASTFLPCIDCSIRVFQPRDSQLFGFSFNSITFNAISFKPQKVCAMMVNL